MTSKLAIKQSKKDRPRSSEKIAASKSARRSKGGGTPDNKAVSPLVDTAVQNGNTLDYESPVLYQSELDKEIKSLRINPKDLKSNVAPLPSKVEHQSKVLVKKRAQIPNLPKQNKRITVARRAPSNTEIKLPIPEDYPGVRLDNSGRIIPHSILGSVEDFIEQAVKVGDKVNSTFKTYCKSSPSPWPEDEENMKLLSNAPETGQTRIDETRALENWERQMKMRKKEQQYLSDTMNVPLDMLLMNQDADFRMKQEDRALIDRAIPAMDYGKGYRVGSEFWKQVENVGGDKGINMTLTQTERGFAPAMEYIGKPDEVRRSVGTDWSETRRIAHIHYPWTKSEFLRERKQQLIGVINELAPHRPYIDGLEIIGQSVDKDQEVNNNKETEDEASTVTDEISDRFDDFTDPLADYEDVVPLPIFGPSLTINGYSAQWKDLSGEKETDNGLEIRLQFQAEAASKSSSSIDITNDGTAAIYFSWKKIASKDPFAIKNVRPLQRFYFDIRNGVILPNDSIKLKFTFKSPNAGIFSEMWQLHTQPVLCGGAPITIVLKGIATEEDKLAEQRKELEEELQRRQKTSFIREIVEEIFNGVRTPPRPSTPIDTYLTEEELFSRQNDKMTFNTEAVTDLKYFHQQLNPDEDWDMSIQTLLKEVKSQEDDETKESLIQKLNEDVQMFAFETDNPVQRSRHNFCYQLLCEAVDNFYAKAHTLRMSMGLPEKEFMVEVQQEEVTKKPKKGQSQDIQKSTPDKKLESKKKDTRPASSRGKSSGNPKTRGKDGTSTSSSNQKQLNVDSAASKSYGYNPKAEKRVPATPLEVRYNEKLYMQMYDILGTVADKIEEMV